MDSAHLRVVRDHQELRQQRAMERSRLGARRPATWRCSERSDAPCTRHSALAAGSGTPPARATRSATSCRARPRSMKIRHRRDIRDRDTCCQHPTRSAASPSAPRRRSRLGISSSMHAQVCPVFPGCKHRILVVTSAALRPDAGGGMADLSIEGKQLRAVQWARPLASERLWLADVDSFLLVVRLAGPSHACGEHASHSRAWRIAHGRQV